MQLILKLKRILPLVALIGLVLVSSCGTKKYGCPGHMFTPPTLVP